MPPRRSELEFVTQLALPDARHRHSGTAHRLRRPAYSPRMPTFILRLIAPRPNFAQTLTDTEREVMNRHAAHWRPYLERGDMIVFGPVLTEESSYGLAVVDTGDEPALREFAAQDPVVTTETAAFEFGRLAAGHVRGR
jgi:uncharacterized protein YciI